MNCPLCNSYNLTLLGKNPTFIDSDIYDCRDCQLAFTHPLPTVEQLSKFYQPGFYDKSSIEEFKSELSQHFSKTLSKYIINNKNLFEHRPISQYKFIYPFLPDTQDKTVLEIGCSSGSLLALLVENGFKVTGYEPDIKMALLASKRLDGPGNIIFSRMINSEDWKANSFDLICSSHVLEHISNPIEHLKLVKESLKKNGILFMEVPNEYSLGINKVIDKNINPASAEQGHLFYYSPLSLEILLNSCGFDILSMKTCGQNVKNYFPGKISPQRQIYNPLLVIPKIMSKLYEVYKSFTKVSAIDSSESLFDSYYENDQEGVWIRVVASVQN
jgi:SAM-dependent methyltransferase